MPVVLIAWEAEIRLFMVPGQPGQENFMRPYLSGKKLEMVVHTCHPSYCRKLKIGGL
jgi:hypothetical protein